MDCCGLCTPGYQRLLDTCYPTKSQLASNELKPSSNELSRLAFDCSNSPAPTLANVCAALDKKVNKASTAAATGKNVRAKAKVCVSLAILKRLLEDCRLKLPAAAPHALHTIDRALRLPDSSGSAPAGGSWDLEVVEHAASAFAVLATLADASWLSVDQSLAKSYLDLLQTWSNIASQSYEQNPAMLQSTSDRPALLSHAHLLPKQLRMLALYALSTSFSADAFESTEPEQQVAIVLPVILVNLTGPSATIPVLNEEVQRAEQRTTASREVKPTQRIPLEKRRPMSFRREHHGELEKERQHQAVIGQALLVLRLLCQRCRTRQLEAVFSAVVTWLDAQQQRWSDVEWCCWLAQTLTLFAHVQYRYVTVTMLLDALLNTEQAQQPSQKQITLLSMITAVLTGSIPLLGLGLAEVLGSLVSIMSKRAAFGAADPFLPALVDSTASLASKTYYLDQISDLVGALISALKGMPAEQSSERSVLGVTLNRCLIGVLQRAQGSRSDADAPKQHVPSSIWQESLFLLTDLDPLVRFTYAHALLAFLHLGSSDKIKEAQPGAKEFFEELTVQSFRLAMGQLSNKPASSASPSPPASTKSEKEAFATQVAQLTTDDCSALQTILQQSLLSQSSEATLAIVPMLFALLNSDQDVPLPAMRDMAKACLLSARHAWAQGPAPTASLPSLRSLQEGPSGQPLAQMDASSATKTETPQSFAEELARSPTLQAASGHDSHTLLALLKEPWTGRKPAPSSGGGRVRSMQFVNSKTFLASPSAGSFKQNTSVSDLRASLISPTFTFAQEAEDSPVSIKRRSALPLGEPISDSPSKSSSAASDSKLVNGATSPTKSPLLAVSQAD